MKSDSPKCLILISFEFSLARIHVFEISTNASINFHHKNVTTKTDDDDDDDTCIFGKTAGK